MPKAKTRSAPLSKKEIEDVKKARKSKGKIYKTPERLIRDLHRNADRFPKETSQKRKQKDNNLWPEEEKVARLYKASKLKFKAFKNVEDLIKDLHS